MNDIGATRPLRLNPAGRWQVWQFSCMIGATSLWYVTAASLAAAGADIPIRTPTAATTAIREKVVINAASPRPAPPSARQAGTVP